MQPVVSKWKIIHSSFLKAPCSSIFPGNIINKWTQIEAFS